ncbi:HEAT repeat domain-containing protein [Natrarchaeobius sp. A-rgal3]|uniref:HEAT repeat domain-containing protein n=1 Tax=Natrarchaeobius versutus TaxID=1679078 RepID=UPI00350F13EF
MQKAGSMDRDGGESVDQRPGSNSFDLPSVLVQLDDRTPATQREAVRTIRDNVEERPRVCLPAVPKLRALLAQPSLECHDTVAYCLAELAEESPVDVAPSVDEIVAFLANDPPPETAADLLRCLESIAVARPDVLADHVDVIATHLESDDSDVRAAAATTLGRVGLETDVAVGGVRERLADLAANDPSREVRDRAQRARTLVSG